MSKKILFAASECAPFVKTGGLADVAAALPVQLREMGADIRVVLPLYAKIKAQFGMHMRHECDFNIKLGWRNQYCGVESLVQRGITYYFIDNEYYFGRDYIYGVFNCDEAERFGFFSKAIIEMLPHIGFMPDALHLNDWQTAMAAALMKLHYAKMPYFSRIKTILTIHNLRFQGVFDRGFCDELLSLGEAAFDMHKLEFYGNVNYLKGGIVYADKVTTVSPTYAKEIMTKFYGESLEGVLAERAGDVVGILNGIDTVSYDPFTDEALRRNYCPENMSGKAECKAALQNELDLDVDPSIPVAAIVSRLTGQKGLDLVERVLKEMMNIPIQLVVLGTGESRYENLFRYAQRTYPGRLAARIEYNDALARRIFAGADIFLVPSLFEPCGLTQMIAMRYGTVPIVRETGGLKDTVTPFNRYDNTGCGYSFANYNAHELLYAAETAAKDYQNKPLWNGLISRGMAKDFSWKKAAGEYLEIMKN